MTNIHVCYLEAIPLHLQASENVHDMTYENNFK